MAVTAVQSDSGHLSPLDVIKARLRERVRFAKLSPKPGFDPLRASPEELAAFKLPPRPDAKRTPLAFVNWRRMMSPPLWFMPQAQLDRFAADTSVAFTVSETRRQHQLLIGGPLTQESSRNWSGAYLRDNPAKRFVRVQASWIVPRPYPPPPEVSEGPWRAGIYHASTWIGLDGHDPGSLSLPQLGTSQVVTLPQDGDDATQLLVSVGAWWQWWVKGDPGNRPIDIPAAEFLVQPGDLIAAGLDLLDNGTVRFTLKNQSSGQVYPPFDVAPPQHQGGPLTVEGRTAEWIVERPTQPESSDLLPFCDYGSVAFSNCNAAVVLGQGLAEERSPQNARLIRLADWTPNRPGTTDQPGKRHPGIIVSTPSLAGAQTMVAQYSYSGG